VACRSLGWLVWWRVRVVEAARGVSDNWRTGGSRGGPTCRKGRGCRSTWGRATSRMGATPLFAGRSCSDGRGTLTSLPVGTSGRLRRQKAVGIALANP
jgi:hypothetical protein